MIDEEKVEITEEQNNNESLPNPEVTPTEVVTENVEETGKKKKKKKSKARVIIEWILTGIFGVFFVIVLVGQIDGMVHAKEHYNQQIRLGFGSFVVLTDSMEPEYPVNTAIVTYLEKEEDIVNRFNSNGGANAKIDLTFMNNRSWSSVCPRDNPDWQNNWSEVVSNQVMTHRLFEIHQIEGKYYFVTAGINTTEGEEGGESYRKKEQYQILTYEQLLGVVKVNSPFLGQVFKILSSPIGLLIFLLIPAAYLIITSIIDILRALKDAEEAPVTETKGSVKSLDKISNKDRERLKKELLEEMLNKSKEKKDNEK
ncbi:MAG: hypothetical protein K5925_05155 [Bacilli bacterium]|nr:hypothetical protein [Bacilli bacterium]